MNSQNFILIFIPLYMTYILLIGLYMFRTRVRAVKAGQIHGQFFKSYQGSQPEYLQICQNHFNNQFQVPLLFIATCLAMAVMNKSTFLILFLASAFFVSRIAHTFIHLGSNKVLLRARVYFFGYFVLIAMWVVALIQ